MMVLNFDKSGRPIRDDEQKLINYYTWNMFDRSKVYHALPTAGKTVASFATNAIDTDAVLELKFGSWKAIDDWYACHSYEEQQAMKQQVLAHAMRVADVCGTRVYTNTFSHLADMSFGFEWNVLRTRFLARWEQRHQSPTQDEVDRRNRNIKRLRTWWQEWWSAAQGNEYKSTEFVLLDEEDHVLDSVCHSAIVNRPVDFGGEHKRFYEEYNLDMARAYNRRYFWDINKDELL